MQISKQFENWREQLRAAGVTLRLRWEAPRWKRDKGRVQFYTIHRDFVPAEKAPLCCVVTHYGDDDGFRLWLEPGDVTLEACTAAVHGGRL